MVEIAKQIEQFHGAALRLNQVSDSMNDILSKAEEQIAVAKPGLEFWLDDEKFASGLLREAAGSVGEYDLPNNATDPERVYYLGFAKIDGQWRLALRTNIEWKRPDQEWGILQIAITPIAQAPRNLRIEAVEALPRFLEDFRKRIEAAVSTIEKALQ